MSLLWALFFHPPVYSGDLLKPTGGPTLSKALIKWYWAKMAPSRPSVLISHTLGLEWQSESGLKIIEHEVPHHTIFLMYQFKKHTTAGHEHYKQVIKLLLDKTKSDQSNNNLPGMDICLPSPHSTHLP